MRLGDWLHRQQMTRESFGELVGVHHSAVTKWVHGRMPRREHLIKIGQVTNGQVTADDFVEDEAASASCADAGLERQAG